MRVTVSKNSRSKNHIPTQPPSEESKLSMALHRLTSEPKYEKFLKPQSEEFLAEIINAIVQTFYRKGKQKYPVTTTKESLNIAMEIVGFTPVNKRTIGKAGSDSNLVEFQNKKGESLELFVVAGGQK
ncbi:MAG: hypothetical protein HQL69_20360 [Magnetococcales bacterium]|nr:hypothetical protein [Magnetococcales bacterium]